jgi:transcriptional regulator with XRE-family HTH domain
VSAGSGGEPSWIRHDPLQRFAKNLRVARAALGVSQEKVAEAAGMQTSYYSRLERAVTEPGVRTMARVARGLEVTPAQLMEGVEWVAPSWMAGPAEQERQR